MTQNSDQKRFRDYMSCGFLERHEDIEKGSRLQELHLTFSETIDRLATLWVEKVRGYGTSRYDQHDIMFDAWMNFSDIYRKFIRLEQLTRDAADGNLEALDALLDAYADMANYSVSAIMVLNEHRKGQQ